MSGTGKGDSAVLLTLKDTKPCPFCGGKKLKLFDIGGVSYLTVTCKTCMADGPQEDDDEREHSAVARWNRRSLTADQG